MRAGIDELSPPRVQRRNRPGSVGKEGEVALERFAGLRVPTGKRERRDEDHVLGLLVWIGCDRPAVPFDRLIVVLQPEIGVRLVRIPVIEKRIVWAQPNGLVEKF